VLCHILWYWRDGLVEICDSKRETDWWSEVSYSVRVWWTIEFWSLMYDELWILQSSVVICCSVGIRLRMHWLVLWRCLAVSVSASSSVGRCDVSTKPEVNYLLHSVFICWSWRNSWSTWRHVLNIRWLFVKTSWLGVLFVETSGLFDVLVLSVLVIFWQSRYR